MRKKTKTILFVVLSLITGTLLWELLEQILQWQHIDLNLSTEPVGFDLRVLSVFITANPGTAGGTLIAWWYLRRLKKTKRKSPS